jgi:hypothetical protein
MEFRQTLILNPRFDFLSFFEDQLFTDCEIHLYEHDWSTDFQVIKAHRAVLATSSAFFENVFTSGMQESRSGIVDVRNALFPPLLQVVRFLYCGTITFTDDTVMQIYSHARDFNISSLIELLDKYLSDCTAALIRPYVAPGFDFELEKELHALVPFIAKKYTEISMANFSRALDVATFLKVQEQISGKSPLEKFNDFSAFMGQYAPGDEEKVAIGQAFKNAPPEVQAPIRKIGYAWLPKGFGFDRK